MFTHPWHNSLPLRMCTAADADIITIGCVDGPMHTSFIISFFSCISIIIFHKPIFIYLLCYAFVLRSERRWRLSYYSNWILIFSIIFRKEATPRVRLQRKRSYFNVQHARRYSDQSLVFVVIWLESTTETMSKVWGSYFFC